MPNPPFRDGKPLRKVRFWKSFEDIKQHFNAPDRVGKCVVFDIKHDNFRLIAIVEYARATVIVKDFLKHSDYDKDRWKNECCG